ncbi:MAG: S-layer family protein, partial [Stigonema ocellatum SAG 48.90 = DSM 106950]|nr:S-layer family protein [Stigonema ocellatum SAG 48.90 = DSM 106950]
GQLNAYGGRVELGGLISPGFVGLNVDGDKLSLNFPASSTRADISLTNNAQVYVEAAGGGDIAVNARNLEVSGEGSVLSAGIGGGLGSFGAKAGDITLNATGDIKIDGNGSGIVNRVQQQAIGNGGDITLSTNSLALTNDAQLEASTRGQGDAGNVIINATKSVSLDGSRSAIFSSVGSADDTPEQLNAFKGNGGNIQITTPQFSLTKGAQLTASTFGKGDAGTIKVNAANVTISGKSSDYNSGLYVNSQSQTGTAGDIIVTSPRVTLDNSGTLNAQSESGNGGNINLQSDLLIMRRSALISTTAGTAQAGGNGGNITINTPNGFIVAVPKENSNITANAFKGSGGQVQINATGIYGLTVLSRENLVKMFGNDLNQIDFQKLPSSITAISQTNPNLNGQVNLNTPDVDPSRGLTQLPINLVDASSQIDNSCNPGSKQRASSFTITGRGGLPPNPGELLSTDAVDVGLVTLNHGSDSRKSTTLRQKPTPIRKPIVQATGWTRNSKGEVVLTADASNVTPQSPWQNPQSCHGVP